VQRIELPRDGFAAGVVGINRDENSMPTARTTSGLVDWQTHATCLGCGYALRGLQAQRCPECGRDFDPQKKWTMRLPRQPSRLVRWFATPPRRSTRLIPWLAIALTAWGTRVPGWGSFSLQAGMILAGACWLGINCSSIARRDLVAEGWLPPISRDERRTASRLNRLLAIVPVLIVLRPTMYLCFLLMLSSLNRVAAQFEQQPFRDSLPEAQRWIGVAYVGEYQKCPHGFKVQLSTPDWLPRQFAEENFWGERPPGFVYKPEPGECVKFRSGRPLWRHWHAEGWF
jgi:hypothetical protein